MSVTNVVCDTQYRINKQLLSEPYIILYNIFTEKLRRSRCGFCTKTSQRFVIGVTIYEFTFLLYCAYQKHLFRYQPELKLSSESFNTRVQQGNCTIQLFQSEFLIVF